MKTVEIAALVILAALVAGCNTTGRMAMPKAKESGHVEISTTEQLKPIAFEKVITAIRRGTVIAHYPGMGKAGFDVSLCNKTYGSDAKLEWSVGTSKLSGWSNELGEIFYDTMESAGYNVVGDPKALFNADKERQKALYMVAGRITDIKGNICEQHHWYFGTPEDRYAAEFFMKVEWTVYSSTLRKVVAQFETEGMARHDKPTRQGIFTTFIDAFADATDALANNQDFYHLAKGDAPDQDVIPIAERGQKNFEPLALTQVPVSTQPMGRHMADTQAAVVTVRLGGSHGSGFLIGGNGLILTNYHVVTDTSEVTIVFDSGLEIVGKVLRRDSIRDVALVQVPVRGVAPLPLRLDGTLRATDTVFAIGTPIELDLKTTVTKGVVSAFRQEERTGNRYIQSDVDISGGNSGGPLLDEFGNVVGISVAGVGPVSVGLNLFIPIEDALDALNLHVSGRSGS